MQVVRGLIQNDAMEALLAAGEVFRSIDRSLQANSRHNASYSALAQSVRVRIPPAGPPRPGGASYAYWNAELEHDEE
jgi:hypothetical protein